MPKLEAYEAIDHMASFFCQVERIFHDQESNRQPLPSYLGTTPPSYASLGPLWPARAPAGFIP